MNPQLLSAIFAGMALGGQIMNYILNLKIRQGQLESENRIMAKVEEKLEDYRLSETCNAMMAVPPRGKYAP